MISRSELRGKILEKDCHKAYVDRDEKDRILCCGLRDDSTEDICIDCIECGAYELNVIKKDKQDARN